MTSLNHSRSRDQRVYYVIVKDAIRQAILKIATLDPMKDTFDPRDYNNGIQGMKDYLRRSLSAHEKSELGISANILAKICRGIIDMSREDDSSQTVIL